MLNGMTTWLRAANPAGRITDIDTARRAARWASISLVGSAMQNAYSLVFTPTDKADLRELMMLTEGPVSREQGAANLVLYDRIADVVLVANMVISVIAVICVLGLAVFQWKRPNRVIPLLALLMFAIAAATWIKTFLDPYQRVLVEAPSNTAHLLIAIVLAVPCIAAYRGASQYSKLLGAKA